ncbi:MAG TPA: SMC-Scp complex subunit ScpB [Bdellovibrionota bacterium]|nr:SMC-Scp complex subunit ScpB [Bdellovibrionota bacterium]
MEQLTSIIEGLLFASEKPLPEARFSEVLGDKWDKDSIRKALEELRTIYEAQDRPISLEKISAGYQFRTKPSLAPFVRKLFEQRPQRLTQASVEVLAIVAYRQPIVRHEIEKIRGVDCGPILRTLLERKLVRVLGRSETPGRPLLYASTKEFLEFFGLPDLAGLPSLRDVKDLGKDQQELILEEIKDDPLLVEQTRALFERSEFMTALEDPNLTIDTEFLKQEIKNIKVETPQSSLVREEEALAHAEVSEEEILADTQPRSSEEGNSESSE